MSVNIAEVSRLLEEKWRTLRAGTERKGPGRRVHNKAAGHTICFRPKHSTRRLRQVS